MSYNFSKKVPYTFQDALEKTKAALSNEGFGIITEIDLQEKFKEKLNIDFRNYRILGACNPKMAHLAIEQEDKIGVLLPCNVVIQEAAGGEIEITAVNPMESMSAVHNENLESIAKEVSMKLQTVVESL